MASWTTRIGTEIAGHRIERLIGRGGMSVVYLAEHRRLGTKIALKVLAPTFSGDDEFQERFRRESRLAASLDHPNVIPIYDAGEDNGMLYITMRYIDGPDLGTLVAQEGQLPLSRMLFIVEQIAGALDEAHAAGLVHRDVKPQNILIDTKQDRAYLSDFGIVKHTLTGQSLTRTGSFLGTAHYSSPEQIEGRPVDARTDVYSLGGVVYTCLVGSPPYEKDTEVAVMNAHLSEPPPALNVFRPDLPPALGHVIATAMAKDKDDRYRTMSRPRKRASRRRVATLARGVQRAGCDHRWRTHVGRGRCAHRDLGSRCGCGARCAAERPGSASRGCWYVRDTPSRLEGTATEAPRAVRGASVQAVAGWARGRSPHYSFSRSWSGPVATTCCLDGAVTRPRAEKPLANATNCAGSTDHDRSGGHPVAEIPRPIRSSCNIKQ